MPEFSPWKQVLFFTKIKKIWLFINKAIIVLDISKLKYGSITLLSNSCE